MAVVKDSNEKSIIYTLKNHQNYLIGYKDIAVDTAKVISFQRITAKINSGIE